VKQIVAAFKQAGPGLPMADLIRPALSRRLSVLLPCHAAACACAASSGVANTRGAHGRFWRFMLYSRRPVLVSIRAWTQIAFDGLRNCA
jgi:hypothetical protein